jgi:hypothetical protein
MLVGPNLKSMAEKKMSFRSSICGVRDSGYSQFNAYFARSLIRVMHATLQ